MIVCSGVASGLHAQLPAYTNQTEIGFLAGEPGGPSRAVFTVQTFNGLALTGGLAGGITAGVDVYPELILLPLSLGVRGDIFQAGVSPFYGIDVGYGFDWLENESEFNRYSGGLMLNPAVGVRIGTKSRSALLFSVGYKYQRAGYYRAAPFLPTSPVLWYTASEVLPPGVASVRNEEYRFNRVSVRMGIRF